MEGKWDLYNRDFLNLTEQIVEFNLGWKPRKDRKGMGSQKDRKKMIFLFLSLLYPFAILFLSFFYLFAIRFLSFWKPILFLSVSYPFVIPSFFVFFCYLFSVFQLWPTLQICLGFKMFCFAKDLRVLHKKNTCGYALSSIPQVQPVERGNKVGHQASHKKQAHPNGPGGHGVKWLHKITIKNANRVFAKSKPRICKMQPHYLIFHTIANRICDQEWTCLSACPFFWKCPP